MNWRKLFKIVHRDLGYLCVGLTIVYAVSGVAVNHIEDWNPNYSIEYQNVEIEPTGYRTLTDDEIVERVLKLTEMEGTLKNSYRPSEHEIDIYLEGATIKANLRSGFTRIEKINSRDVIRETNFLHLNNPKGVWTYVADAFAVSLIILAVTGMFLLRGKKGITGRGKWFILAGFAIPIVFLIIYYY